MGKTVVGLFPSDRKLLSELLDDLARKVIPQENVSTVQGEENSAGEDAGKGALVGGVAGLAIGASTLMIPGIGWVAIAGPVATMLAGAAAGAAAGGLIGALANRGIPEEHAHFYAEGLRRGGTLVIVNAENAEQIRGAEEAMLENGAVDIQRRRSEWMQQGWRGRFDADGDRALALRDEEFPLAAVCVYDMVIEMPAQYSGPERRRSTQRYSGTERRAA